MGKLEKLCFSFVSALTFHYLCAYNVHQIKDVWDAAFFQKKKKRHLIKDWKRRKRVFGKLTRAVAGKSKVDDDVLDRLEEVLVTSDVDEHNAEHYRPD